jgi:hypothetical protein
MDLGAISLPSPLDNTRSSVSRINNLSCLDEYISISIGDQNGTVRDIRRWNGSGHSCGSEATDSETWSDVQDVAEY